MVGVSEWGLKTCQKVQQDYHEESWEPLKPMFVNPAKAKATAEEKNGNGNGNGNGVRNGNGKS